MYICPICRKNLKKLDKVWHCQNGHSFDIARKGYVNLLTTKKRNPGKSGDNSEMVKARTMFLDKGYYLSLAQEVRNTARKITSEIDDPVIIDSGCGEGYYTCVTSKIEKASIYGIDISKYAIDHCMSRVHLNGIKNCEFAVASSFELPFRDRFADLIISIFAPVSNDEYARVLKKGGKLIVVSPSPKHLIELKSILYVEPYENKPNIYGLNKFDLLRESFLEYRCQLSSNEDILHLFSMTPYYYKTPAAGVKKLEELNSLQVTFGFSIRIYEKKFD